MSHLENFHYQVLGNPDGPRLVFLHGLLGSGNNWRKITSQLQDRYYILLYDQRGHGRSFQPSTGYSPEDYANDLRLILDELSWEDVHLVGHSMGGRNSLVFASLYPERLRSLVIEDISPASGEETADRIERLLSLVPIPFESRDKAKTFFQEEFPRRLMGNDKAQTLANYFYTNIEEKPDGTAGWRFSFDGIMESLKLGRLKDRWQEVQDLSVPTLWIRGSRSEDLPKADFEKISELNSAIETVEIAESGHWVHFDQAEVFTEHLKRFLRAQDGLPL